MRVDRYAFDADLTQDQVDEIINQMVLNLSEFSKIACIDGQGYGVTPACDTCGIALNSCVRSHLVNQLVAAQAFVEKRLGYATTVRYHEEYIDWDGSPIIQTNFPGIEALSVRRNFASISGYGPFTISPYIQENITLTDSGDGYCIAEFSASLIPNPNKAIIRDEDGNQYPTQRIGGFPRKVGGNWQVALDKRPSPPCDEDLEFHVQHCEYMILEVPAPTCSGTVLPVYPGSNQIIPQAKAVQTISGGNLRYWFHPWVLVDEAFADEGVDLGDNEFYKLISQVEFRCVTDVAAAAEITFQSKTCESCPQTTFVVNTKPVRLNIKNAERGIIHVETDEIKCPTCSGLLFGCSCKHPVQLKIYYKTNPSILGIAPELVYVREAIAYLAAAELPTSSCECTLEKGFIADAQKAYTEIRVTSAGDQIIHLKFGNTFGHLTSAEKLSRVKKYRKSFVM